MEVRPLGEADGNVTPLAEPAGKGTWSPPPPQAVVADQKPSTSVPLIVRGAPIWAK